MSEQLNLTDGLVGLLGDAVVQTDAAIERRNKKLQAENAKKLKAKLVEGKVTAGYKRQARELDKLVADIQLHLREELGAWMKTYDALKKIQDEELCIAYGYSSFSKWLHAVAKPVFGVNPSLLWKRLKAGRFYDRYIARMEKRGLVDQKKEPINVSAETLVLVEKVADGNENQEDALMHDVEEGKLTNKGLKQAYNAARAERIANGKNPARQNAHDKSAGGADTSENKITAARVILALQNFNWLEGVAKKQITETTKGVAKLVTEFPVETGETAHARRMDALVLETYSVDEHDYDYVRLHGVEVKVSKSDLTNDKKMGDYPQFVDYFWLAVPDELVDEAKQIAPEKWGIITLSDSGDEGVDVARVERQAVFEEGVMRDMTLMRYIRKYSLKSE